MLYSTDTRRLKNKCDLQISHNLYYFSGVVFIGFEYNRLPEQHGARDIDRTFYTSRAENIILAIQSEITLDSREVYTSDQSKVK